MSFYSLHDFDPERSVGYLVRHANQLAVRAIEPALSAEGLSGVQWSALATLCFGRAKTGAEIARDIGYDKGAMTRLTDVLERNGWIERRRDDTDRRVVFLVLTEAGQAVTRRALRGVVASWNRWLDDWSEDEVTQLILLLQKLRRTLTDAPTSERRA